MGITVDMITDRVFSMLRPRFKEEFEKLVEFYEDDSDKVMNEVYKQYSEVKLLAVVNYVHQSSKEIEDLQERLRTMKSNYKLGIKIIEGYIEERQRWLSSLSNGSKRKVKGGKVKAGVVQQQKSPEEKRDIWNDEIAGLQRKENDILPNQIQLKLGVS